MNDILSFLKAEYQKAYSDTLVRLYLYGSYARGDFKPDSDIDIMILVDMTDIEIREKGQFLSEATFEYNFDNNIMIMPIVKNLNHFNKWLRAYPFYF